MLERRFQQSVGRPLGVTLICVWFLMNFVGSLGLTLIVLTGADFIRLITGLLPGNSPLLSPYLFAVVLLLVAIADFADHDRSMEVAELGTHGRPCPFGHQCPDDVGVGRCCLSHLYC